MHIVMIADTHACHRDVEIGSGDLLIHAGDFTMFSRSARDIADFNAWLGELPFRHRVIIPGNHEFLFESNPRNVALITNAIVLINESVVIEGLRIWGSPSTPLYGGAFGLSSGDDRRVLYSRIPLDTDVLITHSPPHGILDSPPGAGIHAGCEELRLAVDRVRPLLHVFGHIHGAHGRVDGKHTAFINAALLGLDGGIEHVPISVRMTAQR